MNIKSLVAIPMLALTISGCQQQVVKPQSVTEVSKPVASCSGPKLRVAVLPFGATGKLGSYEGFDVGESLAAQLTTALSHTGCFVVADRMALSHVLREQEMGLVGVTNPETAPRTGGVIGAQVLIKTDITEYEPNKESGGLNFGFASSKLPFGLRLGGSGSTSHVALDLRLLDATTGEVLFSRRVEASSKSSGLALGLDFKQMTVGGDKFYKTPLGQATRVALADAVNLVIRDSRQIPWQGQVISTRGDSIFINAGQDVGLNVGDVLQVSGVAEELIDPESGRMLGRVESPLGRVQVKMVQDKYAVVAPLSRFEARRGDIIRF
ncbi:CsgG/HfaB family protein [Marinobacterium jannaschii]|uniref:CsgG/HfaB family protein n=1 Tax=Marinobacterium jannaschii TaxID=64970 RepID=UPI000487B798|nr:CsgG/HfaB family protein [Marinobacterium jannaschii]